MVSWIDVVSLFVTTIFFVGTILGILYAARAFSSRAKSTKASLESKGITISREGVSLKTQKRFDRDDYVDATQRGFVKALNAATVGSESRKHHFLPNAANEKQRSSGVAMHRSQSDGR